MNKNLERALAEFDLIPKLESGPIGDLYSATSEIVDLTGMTISQSASDEEPSIWDEQDQNNLATAISVLAKILNRV